MMTRVKSNLHPDNPHRHGYDFNVLSKASPEIKNYIIENFIGDQTIDFKNSEAVKALNKAILYAHYDLKSWDIPRGYLCPPIPGRADYLLYMADLLASESHKKKVKNSKIVLFDVGIGANCIYPLLAHKLFKWRSKGSEIADIAIENANNIISSNKLENVIQIVKQDEKTTCFQNLIDDDEYYDLLICNPPFHKSKDDAEKANSEKWKKLGVEVMSNMSNFGGMANELWCEGGELSFVEKMIEESVQKSKNVLWYSSLISKKEHCEQLMDKLSTIATKHRIIPMSQGQKKSRILAWTHFNKKQRKAWMDYRWS